jgi:nicotinate-nucleotide adenylyltransferase
MGPTASITFILGGDSVAQLHRWHRWREITSLVNLAILSRPGAPEVEDAEVLAWLKEHELAIDQWQQPEKGAVCWLEQPLLDVSSSVLRDMIARRKNVSFLLPAAVIEYIENHGLYRF